MEALMKPFTPIDEVRRAKQGKKRRQAFYTPLALVDRMIEFARTFTGCRALEPSAGDGRIVHGLIEAGCIVDACEIDTEMFERCRSYGAKMIGEDFLALTPTPRYDLVVMNPPFHRAQAKRHIEHAYRFLKPTGQLVAIAPHDFAQRLASCQLELPGCDSATCVPVEGNAFKEAGANVKTQLITIEGSEPDGIVEGFSNGSTYNAALTIATDHELLTKACGKSAEELRGAFSKAIAEAGGSCYGVNWKEVAEYLEETGHSHNGELMG